MMSGNDVRTPRQLSTSPCALLAGVQWFSTRTSSLERASPPQVMGMMYELCLISCDFLHVMAYSPVVLCMHPGSLKDEPFWSLLRRLLTTPLVDHVGIAVCTPGLDHRSSLPGRSRLLPNPRRNLSQASRNYFGLSAYLQAFVLRDVKKQQQCNTIMAICKCPRLKTTP